MLQTRMNRFAALAVLASLTMFPGRGEGNPLQECFSQCYVMEVGCAQLGGSLVGSCSYNSGLPSDQQCHMPACVCSDRLNGICQPGEDDPPLAAGD